MRQAYGFVGLRKSIAQLEAFVVGQQTAGHDGGTLFAFSFHHHAGPSRTSRRYQPLVSLHGLAVVAASPLPIINIDAMLIERDAHAHRLAISGGECRDALLSTRYANSRASVSLRRALEQTRVCWLTLHKSGYR
jgi:hypothetical protein